MRFESPRPGRSRIVAVLLIAIAWCSQGIPAHATTGPDLRSRIVIDGDTRDFASDESIFGNNGAYTSFESSSDSRWGYNDDVSGIRITWDRRALYLAVEGICWNNNVILLIDAIPNQGMSDMLYLNSWRRYIVFSPDFAPDGLLATWDGYTAARWVAKTQAPGSIVADSPPGALFQAVSSFSQGASGRAMEARLPWTTLLMYSASGSAIERDTTIAGLPDTLVFVPPGMQLRVAAAIVGGGDGMAGPDVAPNNTTGCQWDAGIELLIDNFAIVPVDADHDGLPDMNISPVGRVTFKDISVPVRRSTWGQVKAAYR